MRRYGLAVLSVSLVALVVALLARSPLGVSGQAATPSAATPAASPAAAAPAQSNVVTLVAWYAQDASGDFLTIGPLTTDQNLVGRQAPSGGNQATGKADFSGGPNGEPEITVGDSTFDGVLANPDDPDSMFRWTYYNGEQGNRPASLVIQVKATAGPYKGYVGTATFVSRESTAGGVLVIMLKPAA